MFPFPLFTLVNLCCFNVGQGRAVIMIRCNSCNIFFIYLFLNCTFEAPEYSYNTFSLFRVEYKNNQDHFRRCSTFSFTFSFLLFVFFTCITHSCFRQLRHVVLFWREIRQRTTRQTFTQTKKKNVIWLLKKLGSYERASFCLKCAIYLSERMHIVSIYTSPLTLPQAGGLRSWEN